MKTMKRQPDLFQVIAAGVRRAASRAACTAGSNNETKMPMIVMTTSNSISEKPAVRAGTVPLCHDARCLDARHATATFSRLTCPPCAKHAHNATDTADKSAG